MAYLSGEIVGPSEMYVAWACDAVVAPRLSTVGGLGVAVEVRRLKGMQPRNRATVVAATEA